MFPVWSKPQYMSVQCAPPIPLKKKRFQMPSHLEDFGIIALSKMFALAWRGLKNRHRGSLAANLGSLHCNTKSFTKFFHGRIIGPSTFCSWWWMDSREFFGKALHDIHVSYVSLDFTVGFPLTNLPAIKMGHLTSVVTVVVTVRGIEETGVNLDKVTRQMAAQLGNLVGSKVGHHDPVDGNLGWEVSRCSWRTWDNFVPEN